MQTASEIPSTFVFPWFDESTDAKSSHYLCRCVKSCMSFPWKLSKRSWNFNETRDTKLKDLSSRRCKIFAELLPRGEIWDFLRRPLADWKSYFLKRQIIGLRRFLATCRTLPSWKLEFQSDLISWEIRSQQISISGVRSDFHLKRRTEFRGNQHKTLKFFSAHITGAWLPGISRNSHFHKVLLLERVNI